MTIDVSSDCGGDGHRPWWMYTLRIGVLAVAIVLAYWCSLNGERFFYQGF